MKYALTAFIFASIVFTCRSAPTEDDDCLDFSSVLTLITDISLRCQLNNYNSATKSLEKCFQDEIGSLDEATLEIAKGCIAQVFQLSLTTTNCLVGMALGLTE